MSHHRMRLPHARITILALCGLAAAAGVAGAAVSLDATPPSAPGPVAAYGFDGTGPRVADASDNANDGATTAARTQASSVTVRSGLSEASSGMMAAAVGPSRCRARPKRPSRVRAAVVAPSFALSDASATRGPVPSKP